MKKLVILLSTLLVSGFLAVVVIFLLGDDIDCLTANRIIDLNSNSAKSQDFRLVAEISGSHDKMVFISLYPKNVTFDVCGAASQPRIFEEMADENRQIDKIVVKDKQINLSYIDTKKPVDYDHIDVIWIP